MNVLARFVWVIATFIAPGLAHAYIGPGAGLSAIGSVIALIGAVFLLILGFLWYPVKRILRKKGNGSGHKNQENTDSDNQV